MNSRFRRALPIPRGRLKMFVALDNLTAQTPLIEIVRKRPYHIRIWVAYDYERKHGTYVAVYQSGLVKTITVYPAGNTEERVSRPKDR